MEIIKAHELKYALDKNIPVQIGIYPFNINIDVTEKFCYPKEYKGLIVFECENGFLDYQIDLSDFKDDDLIIEEFDDKGINIKKLDGYEYF